MDLSNNNSRSRIPESQIQQEILSVLSNTESFVIYEECVGKPLHIREHQEGKEKYRCDLLLIPQGKILDEGVCGAIVVECKAPGMPSGPGLSQILDYMNAGFYVGKSKSMIVPSFGFIYPYNGESGSRKHDEYPQGPLASLMLQQQVGYIKHNQYDNSYTFKLGHLNFIVIRNGMATAGNLTHLRKRKSGSR